MPGCCLPEPGSRKWRRSPYSAVQSRRHCQSTAPRRTFSTPVHTHRHTRYSCIRLEYGPADVTATHCLLLRVRDLFMTTLCINSRSLSLSLFVFIGKQESTCTVFCTLTSTKELWSLGLDVISRYGGTSRLAWVSVGARRFG